MTLITSYCRHITLAIAAALAISLTHAAAAETIKIGILKLASSGPVFIAKERGYFAAENLDPELVFFDAAQPIAVAAAAGAIDFGVGGATAALYSLAEQGKIRIIAGNHREAPTFHNQAFLVSQKAFDNGLRGYADLAGRSVAVSQIGSPPHYTLALIAEKYRIDLKTIQVLPLQSIPNNISAVRGGKADATFLPVTAVGGAIAHGDIRSLGWVGDAVPWQVGVVIAPTKLLGDSNVAERFLRAFRKGALEYHDAFADAHDKRRDGDTAGAVASLIASYLSVAPEKVIASISFIDRDARLDVVDIQHQIAWYRSQDMLKGGTDATVMDKRLIMPLPAR